MRPFGTHLALALGLLLSACGPPADGPRAGASPAVVITGAEVVAAFVAEGLEGEQPRTMTTTDFGLAPRLADDATRFGIPSLGAAAAGRVLVFKDPDDLGETRSYFAELGRQDEQFRSWVFTNERLGVLVQLPGELPEGRARLYEAVLHDLANGAPGLGSHRPTTGEQRRTGGARDGRSDTGRHRGRDGDARGERLRSRIARPRARRGRRRHPEGGVHLP